MVGLGIATPHLRLIFNHHSTRLTLITHIGRCSSRKVIPDQPDQPDQPEDHKDHKDHKDQKDQPDQPEAHKDQKDPLEWTD